MADIAIIFHWPPAAFDGLSLDELMRWRALALERFEVVRPAPGCPMVKRA